MIDKIRVFKGNADILQWPWTVYDGYQEHYFVSWRAATDWAFSR